MDSEREALDSFIRTYQQLIRNADSAQRTIEEQPDLYRSASPRAAQRAQVDDALAAARRIITDANRPMKRGELVRRLEQQGFQLPGNDKTKVFGTNLWRSGRFQSVEGGYWPADVAPPDESSSK